ncbi:MAG: hypothetical protein JO288_02395 [Hyphomicrobiales bacterium]|nr:hypothetical protein [Hyphomicrobiales bacterium]
MSSILNNPSALSALQALQMTQQSLATVQNQVATGLAVASAADNSSYWAISQLLNNDSGIVTATQSALSEGQSVLKTASSAVSSVITTLNSMATALTQAQNPGAQIADINTSLASLSLQLTDSVTGASFNGLNVLNGTQTTLSFVSGYNASATGGSVNTISFSAQAVNGAGGAATTNSTVTGAAMTSLLTQVDGAALNLAPATAANPQVYQGTDGAGHDTLTIVSLDSAGNRTATTYTGIGGAQTGAFQTDGGGAVFTSVNVQTTVTPVSVQSTTNSQVTTASQITNLAATASNAAASPASYNAAPTVNANQVLAAAPGAGVTARFVVNSVDASGNLTSTTYTALNAGGTAITFTGSGAGSAWNGANGIAIASFAVSTTVTAAVANPTTTTSTSTIGSGSTLSALQALYATPGTNYKLGLGSNVNTVTTGVAGATSDTLTVQSMDSNGDITTTVYKPLDANGNVLTGHQFASAVSLSATSTTVWAAGGLLRQSGIDLTGGSGATSTFQIGSNMTAAQGLNAVNQALAAVTNYAAAIGATQDRMTTADTFDTSLTTNYADGVAGLVDANMNTASTQLQALQTQEQLGIQSLSIANQNAALILKLFGL